MLRKIAEWDVVYCSRPTSPGGSYRSALGRLVFKTKEMIQNVEAPDVVINNVSFSLLGFLDGEVSLTGTTDFILRKLCLQDFRLVSEYLCCIGEQGN